MLIAQVKLPMALERDVFNKLSKEFGCIKEATKEKVYEDEVYNYETSNYETEAVIMGSTDYYKDECVLADGHYYNDGKEIDSYYVHDRPTKDYAVVKDRVVILDVDRFYSIVSEVSINIIKAIPIKEYSLDNAIKTLTEKIDMLVEKM